MIKISIPTHATDETAGFFFVFFVSVCVVFLLLFMYLYWKFFEESRTYVGKMYHDARNRMGYSRIGADGA
jgi:hypothetical protein